MMKQAVILAPFLTSRILFLALSFEAQGYSTRILTREKQTVPNADDENCRELWLNAHGGSLCLLDTESVEPTDKVVAFWSQFLTYSEAELKIAERWAEQAQSSVLLSRWMRRDYIGQLAFELRSLLKQGGFLRKFQAIGYEDILIRPSLYSFFFKKFYLGALPHQQYLCDSKLSELLFEEITLGAVRPYLFNFQGHVLPEPRKIVIEKVNTLLLDSPGLHLLKNAEEPLVGGKQNAIWWPFTRKETPNSAESYLAVLSQSSFTLCLPGYTGTTARVVESLIRGSIPVLPESEAAFYTLPFESGKNCILVPEGGWPKVVAELLELPEEVIADMRASVGELRERYLTLPRLKEYFSGRFSA